MVDNKRRHILFLARWYPHRYDPMFGLFVQRHAQAVKKFHDVSVIYIHPDSNCTDMQIKLSETAGVTEIKVYYPKAGWRAKIVSPLRYFQSFVRAYNTLTAFKSKPDLFHVNILTRMGVIAWLMKIFTGTPYIITEHWSRYLPQNNSYRGWLRKLMTRLVVKNAAELTTVTENLRKAMQKRRLKNKSSAIVPNVVDVNLFKPTDHPRKEGPIRLLHLSCFEERSKNMSGILRVVKKLSAKRTDFQLNMVGEGEDRQATLALAEQMGIKDRYVFFPGLKQGKALLEQMQEADLMVMFSHYENLPVVILEAFACGMPVISSDVGGIAEHLNNERGALVPPADEEAFLQRLEQLMDNLESFDRQAIREYAVTHFSNEVIGEQFCQIYQKVLEADG